eukprot:TRINITY_DN65006_c0_g1_i1.p1 TRINITY_DN65006_c0_g1~~TRINITY_DN65006_c0_g1_i1.p1  ORF type:complete len:104 (-),score=39.57 TRINITY_DN65006_c0_g1_i1:137-448(-)
MVFFFFFKQKTAYEMLRSLVGSEMCIRDSPTLIRVGLCEDGLAHLKHHLSRIPSSLLLPRPSLAAGARSECSLEPSHKQVDLPGSLGWAVSYTHLTLPTKRIV